MRRCNKLEGGVLHHQAGAETSTPEDLHHIGKDGGHPAVLVNRWEYEGEAPAWAPWTASDEAHIHAAYHACIGLEGQRHLLIPWQLRASHCSAGKGNSRFIGICLLGNRELHDIPEAQWLGAIEAFARTAYQFNWNPLKDIHSHREIEIAAARENPTLCPGVYVRNRMDEFRQAVKDSLPDRRGL